MSELHGAVSIHPVFEIPPGELENLEALLQDFIDASQNENASLFYGWGKDDSGQELFARESYKDANAVKEHLGNVGPHLQKILAKDEHKVKSLNVSGPKEELDALKEAFDPLGAKYFETALSAKTGSKPSEHKNFVTTDVYYDVVNFDKFFEVCKEIRDTVAKDSDPYFFDIGFSPDKKHAHIRHCFPNAQAVQDYASNINGLVAKLNDPAIGKRNGLVLAAESVDIEQLKEPLAPANPKFYEMIKKRQPKSFVSIHPVFELPENHDAELIAEMVDDFTSKVMNEKAILTYDFGHDGKEVYVREAYSHPDAVFEHMGNVGETIGTWLAKDGFGIKSLMVAGPSHDLEALKEVFDPLGAEYFHHHDSIGRISHTVGGEVDNNSFISLDVVMKVKNYDSFVTACKEAIEITSKDPNTLFYDFSFNEDKTKCLVREGYVGPDDIDAHMQQVGPLLGKMLATDAEILDVTINGSPAQITTLKEKLQLPSPPKFFPIVGGRYLKRTAHAA